MFDDSRHCFLRIIAGSLKGRRFDAPKGGDTVRPVGDRVKESLFDILAPRLQDAQVLDLFGGTGSLGFESLSRGAKSAVYVEKDHRNVRLIRDNAKSLGLESKINIVHGSLPEILKKMSGKFDLVLADPPFATEIIFEIMPLLKDQNLIDQNTQIMIQRFRGSKDLEFEGFEMTRKHKVGDAMLWFFKLAKVGV